MTADITVLRKTHELQATDTPADETHAERAYRLIEDEIVTLSLEPGVRLTEQELAERVGLGRTPVREAVQRLVAEGLLVVYPRKGMAVAAINPLDILQALDVRAALERVVAVAAARRAAPAQRTRLQGIARELVEAARAGDASRYMRLDKAFDEVIGQASGNPFAVRAMAPLQSMARRAWYYFRREQDLKATASRHADVVEAVVAGDEAKAAAASDALVAHVREGLKQALSEL
jgi:DNA-binding GntR family transcriptional regulator